MERASEYIEGGLAPQERSQMQAHLDTCASCAQIVRDVERIISALGALRRIAPSAALDFVLRGLIRRELNRSKHRKGVTPGWLMPDRGFPLPIALLVAFMVFFSVLTLEGLWQHFSARRTAETQNTIMSLHSSTVSGEDVTNHYVLERTTLEKIRADTLGVLGINRASIDTALFASEGREALRDEKITLVTF